MITVDAHLAPVSSPRALHEAIAKELQEFDTWFSGPISSGGLGNAPLIPQELALLRTYLFARLSGRFSPLEDPTQGGEDGIFPEKD